MRVVFRTSATATILATLAIVAGVALSGCGQRGSLYLPTVPPLPAKPTEQTQPPSSDEVKPGAESAQGSVPDTSGTPLSLSPDSELRTAPTSNAPAQPASSASEAQ
ncbi:LPS translocon maturation chaperone LptM [Paraburkholderia terrae]|uniref:LPS translocon maturation chaperone LptM n=1 Tax=Paraburkholderia terrae TaxID=311230 RepID=UPI00296AA5C1|nr:lipoprotein [Paraburkholderia terrae]MDW3661109.1 lipoprotein [Paraburkholderia terrae]